MYSVFYVKVGTGVLAVNDREDHQNEKNNGSHPGYTKSCMHIAQKRNSLSDLDEIWQGDRYPRHSHLHEFQWWSVKIFSDGSHRLSFNSFTDGSHLVSVPFLILDHVPHLQPLLVCSSFHWTLLETVKRLFLAIFLTFALSNHSDLPVYSLHTLQDGHQCCATFCPR